MIGPGPVAGGEVNSALKNISPFNRTPLRSSESASIFLRTPGNVSRPLRKASRLAGLAVKKFNRAGMASQ